MRRSHIYIGHVQGWREMGWKMCERKKCVCLPSWILESASPMMWKISTREIMKYKERNRRQYPQKVETYSVCGLEELIFKCPYYPSQLWIIYDYNQNTNNFLRSRSHIEAQKTPNSYSNLFFFLLFFSFLLF